MKTSLAFIATSLLLNLVYGNEASSDGCQILIELTFKNLEIFSPNTDFWGRGQADEHLWDKEVLCVWSMPGKWRWSLILSLYYTYMDLHQKCLLQFNFLFIQGIFPRLQSDWRCRRVSQVLRQKPGVQLVVLGAGLWALHAFSKLHRGRRRSSCCWALPRLHQWRERVSWTNITIYVVMWCLGNFAYTLFVIVSLLVN